MSSKFNMTENRVGKTICALRKNKKLTQADLGKALGYSARTVSDWENGCTEPNISAIKALVKFFDISYDEFFED
ncbi:MAG: helix-turn-helix transcriptional regulator [Clostridia bacterium]|nr:helix-turn-helix transcriptional regulator [Clostridia bacterium]MDE7348642.1 helix-turn-helix transcriptional regulator [Clostridia bacterium]